MSPLVGFTPADLNRDKVVTPAWYRVRIENVGEWTPSKDGKSQNMVMEGIILFNADTGEKEFADVPIGGMGAWSFNSKAMGFSLGLLKAVATQIGLNVDAITPDSKIEFKLLEGKFVDLYIEPNEYEGRIRNKVNHKYRAPRELATA